MESYVNTCRAAPANMKARGKGVIINVIGAAGERPSAGYIAGAGGNAALMAMTRALGAGQQPLRRASIRSSRQARTVPTLRRRPRAARKRSRTLS